MLVVSVPFCIGVTNMSKYGMEPDLCAPNCRFKGTINVVDIMKEIFFVFCITNVSPTYLFCCLGGLCAVHRGLSSKYLM